MINIIIIMDIVKTVLRVIPHSSVLREQTGPGGRHPKHLCRLLSSPRLMMLLTGNKEPESPEGLKHTTFYEMLAGHPKITFLCGFLFNEFLHKPTEMVNALGLFRHAC